MEYSEYSILSEFSKKDLATIKKFMNRMSRYYNDQARKRWEQGFKELCKFNWNDKNTCDSIVLSIEAFQKVQKDSNE